MRSLASARPPSILPHHEPRRTAQSKTLNARALGHAEIARRPSMLKVKRSKKNRVEAFDVDDPDLDEKLNDAIQRAWERVEEESRRLAEELEDWNPDPDLRGHRNPTSGGRMLRIPRPARFFFATRRAIREIRSSRPPKASESSRYSRTRRGQTPPLHSRAYPQADTHTRGGGVSRLGAHMRATHTWRVSICVRNACA